MTIDEIKLQLKQSAHPVARVLYIKDHFRVLSIGFNNQKVLKDHKTPNDSTLLVTEGHVCYKESEKEIILNQYDEFKTPANEIHSVTALKDSICLLIQS